MSKTAPIKIRIGASVDESVATAFEQVAKLAGKAAAQTGKAQQQTTRTVKSEAEKQAEAAEKAARREVKAAEKAEREKERLAEKSARYRQNLQNRHYQQEEAARRRQERLEASAQERAADSFARRTSHRATRFLMPNAPIGSMAMRGLGGVARGLGIDTSVAGSVGRSVDLERRAIDLSHSGYQLGAEGAKGQRVDPKDLVAQSRDISSKYGIDAGDALGGLEQYQKISGDLDAGRKVMGNLAALSAATGTSLTDMAAAAANVDNTLGNIPDKAKVIDEVMRTVAGQGKMGAVEISDMATQMARVAAAASQFGGSRQENLATMGALVQEARGTGGAPSAAEASRSAVGFASTMRKSARVNAFKEEGIDVYTDKSRQKVKDPLQLIKEALKATNGDQLKMNSLFKDVVGGRAVAGLTQRFNDAGGGDAGMEAVTKRMADLVAAQIDEKQVAADAARAADSQAAKAAKFQNEWDKVVEKVLADLVPALEKAAPAIIEFATVVGKIATWAVENPKLAIAGAIGLSIARAGIESVMRQGIENMLSAAGGGGTGIGGYNPKAGFGGGMGVVGNAAALGTIASLAVTTLVVGMALIDHFATKADEASKDRAGKNINTDNMSGEVRRLAEAGDLAGAKAKAEEQKKLVEANMKATEKEDKTGDIAKALTFALDPLGLTGVAEANASRDAAANALREQQQRELERVNTNLEAIATAIQDGGGLPIPGRQPDGKDD